MKSSVDDVETGSKSFPVRSLHNPPLAAPTYSVGAPFERATAKSVTRPLIVAGPMPATGAS
jgi:hypothetical protein